MAKPRPEKKPAPAPDTRRVLPMGLRIGDRLSDEIGEWEVVGRPYTTAGGKNARVRVQRVGQPAVSELRTWGARERVTVKRAALSRRRPRPHQTAGARRALSTTESPHAAARPRSCPRTPLVARRPRSTPAPRGYRGSHPLPQVFSWSLLDDGPGNP